MGIWADLLFSDNSCTRPIDPSGDRETLSNWLDHTIPSPHFSQCDRHYWVLIVTSQVLRQSLILLDGTRLSRLLPLFPSPCIFNSDCFAYSFPHIILYLIHSRIPLQVSQGMNAGLGRKRPRLQKNTPLLSLVFHRSVRAETRGISGGRT